MAGGIANVASGVVTIDALLGNFKWNSPNLTYNFPDAASYYNASTYFTAGAPSSPTHDFASFAPVTPSLQSAITHAITTQLTAVAPLNYTLVRRVRPLTRALPEPIFSSMRSSALRPAASASIREASSAAAMPGSTSTRRASTMSTSATAPIG